MGAPTAKKTETKCRSSSQGCKSSGSPLDLKVPMWGKFEVAIPSTRNYANLGLTQY